MTAKPPIPSSHDAYREALLPCPFCGGKADYVIAAAYERVFCTNNQCFMENWVQATAARWNTRIHSTLDPSLVDPEMPSQQLRLHMGEMTSQEERTARAAIRWANSIMGDASTRKDEKQMVEATHHGDLVVGAFYWVCIVFDPDANREWENDGMPARYAGGGKWNYLGEDDVSEWPVRWVGPRIQMSLSEREIRYRQIATVEETPEGPRLLLDGERAMWWFGIAWNDKAHAIAAMINTAYTRDGGEQGGKP